MAENQFFIDSDKLSEAALEHKHKLETDPSSRTNHMEYMEGMEQIDSDIMDKVLEQMNSYDYEKYTAKEVQTALEHETCTVEDFKALLSPAALPFLERMAQRAKMETSKHFGNTVYLFTPLYIANYCENYCVYCGFNCYNDIHRKKLNFEEIEHEMKVIADSGIESDLITSTCATDHAAAAKLAADHLCEAIGNSGEVAIVAHQYNTESSVERVEAFKKEIEEKYTDVKVVQVNYGDGEESIADMLKNTLETYPALKGIFCTNEDMADQTLDALADMENTEQIQIVGFDSGEKQQKAIQEGREYGTVTQNPYGLGYAAIVAAVRAIQGLPVDQKIDTGYQWIDKDTIDLETNQKYLYN